MYVKRLLPASRCTGCRGAATVRMGCSWRSRTVEVVQDDLDFGDVAGPLPRCCTCGAGGRSGDQVKELLVVGMHLLFLTMRRLALRLREIFKVLKLDVQGDPGRAATTLICVTPATGRSWLGAWRARLADPIRSTADATCCAVERGPRPTAAG